MNLVLLAVCALVAVAFLWRQYVAGAEERAFRQAGAAVKFLVTIVALVPILMLLVSLWNVATPFSYRVMVESFGSYRTPQPPRQIIQVPQGKSVGGPLRWSDSANVEIRKRFTTEMFVDGIAPVDFIPPGSWIDLKITQQEAQGGNWDAFLVSKNELGFVPNSNLQKLAKNEDHKEGTVLPLKGLNGPLMEFNKRISSSKASLQDGYKLEECYAQVVGNGPKGIRLDRQGPVGTFQYEVKVGAIATSITIPHQNWKWLWIAPVHHSEYQSRLNGKTIPAEGIAIAEAASHMGFDGNELEESLRKSPGYQTRIPCQALVMKKGNGEFQTLDKSALWQSSDFEVGETVELRLNIPSSGSVWGETKPAKIIVGIQQ